MNAGVRTSCDDGTNSRDRGDMVVGWLAKIVVVLAVVAVIGYDTVTTIQGQVTVRDQAGSAAEAGYDSYAASHNVQTAYQAALAARQVGQPGRHHRPRQLRRRPRRHR